MRRLALVLALAALGLHASAAGAGTVTVLPSADVGLPFACDWSYDWEARCYRDDGRRLPVGAVDDKVWRAALRFSLGSVPAAASIVSAELRIHHDGTCVAPRLGSVRCATGYVLDVHRILSASWFREREPDFDERVLATAVVLDGPTPQWLAWDLTALVRAWHARAVPNDGLLVKVQDGDEEPGFGGPYAPSSSFPDPALRPRLVIAYSGG